MSHHPSVRTCTHGLTFASVTVSGFEQTQPWYSVMYKVLVRIAKQGRLTDAVDGRGTDTRNNSSNESQSH